MTQLILDSGGASVVLPETRRESYVVDEEPLSRNLVMIAGNMVKELRGDVWVIDYQYGYFNDADKDRVISACKKGSSEPIVCNFLIPDENKMLTSRFFVTGYTRPRFYWSRDDKGAAVPVWGGFTVSLREVDPHD